MIVVFLNNKLITCDTILPLMMEVHALKPDAKIRFFCFDGETYDVIRRNVVLFDAISNIGDLSLIGSSGGGGHNRMIGKLLGLYTLLGFMVAQLRKRVTYLHFNALNNWPLRLLFVLNSKRTVLCEPTAIGYSEIERKIANIISPRAEEVLLPAAGRLIAFQPNWFHLTNPNLEGVPRHIFSNPRQRKVWLDYVRARAEEDFQRAYCEAGVSESDRIIAYMIGWLGPLRSLRLPDTSKQMLRETLAVLADEAGDVPVFIKPHPITDTAHLAEAVAVHGRRTFIITQLHPSVLATRASALIANYTTSTFADGHFMNAPTIHYTDFSDETLELTGHGSPRPEFVSYFINHDEGRFRQVLRKLLTSDATKMPLGVTGRDDGVLDWLANREREPSS